MPLGRGEKGFREETDSKRELRPSEDFGCLNFRVAGLPLFLDVFGAPGAKPAQMSWADAQPALASDAVEGQENPLTVFTAARLRIVGQRSATVSGCVAEPLIFVANKEAWESWTKEDREIVRQAAIAAGCYWIELSRDGLLGADPAAVNAIEGFAVNVVRLTADERAAFVKARRPVYETWANPRGPDLFK